MINCKNNIILCGFMGSGKTSVGKELSKLTGYEFYDTDSYIEQKANMTVSQIFEKYGEEYFRELETKAITELSYKSNIIIACGGGTVLKKQNAEILKQNGTLFYLDVTVETVIKRLKNDNSRPLISGNEKQKTEKINTLLSKRKPLYIAVADITVNSDNEKSDTAKNILSIIRNEKL